VSSGGIATVIASLLIERNHAVGVVVNWVTSIHSVECLRVIGTMPEVSDVLRKSINIVVLQRLISLLVTEFECLEHLHQPCW
jgi:hypothetical protein